MTSVVLQESSNPKKKFMVHIVYPNGRTKTVHFGAFGYSDYTIHKDPERMGRYVTRHAKREAWTKGGMDTPGFWARWLLWSKPSLSEAIRYTSKRFNITITKRAKK